MVEATGRGDDVREVTAMSLRAHEPLPVPDLTAQVAQAAFSDDCLGMRLRDALGPIFRDDDFADLFPRRGQPVRPPGRDRSPGADRMEIRPQPGTDRPRLRLLGAVRVPGPAHRRQGRVPGTGPALEGVPGPQAPRQRRIARTDSTHVLGAVRVLLTSAFRGLDLCRNG